MWRTAWRRSNGGAKEWAVEIATATGENAPRFLLFASPWYGPVVRHPDDAGDSSTLTVEKFALGESRTISALFVGMDLQARQRRSQQPSGGVVRRLALGLLDALQRIRMQSRWRYRVKILAIGGIVLACMGAGSAPGAQEAHHTITVTARRYAFTPNRIEVHRGDVMTITFETEDVAHSFAIDELRLCKRATPNGSVTFELRVEDAGTFVFYCSLTADPGCRNMRGQLIVR